MQLTALLMANSHVPVLRVRYAVAEAHAPKPASAKMARLADRIDALAEDVTAAGTTAPRHRSFELAVGVAFLFLESRNSSFFLHPAQIVLSAVSLSASKRSSFLLE